MSRRLATPLTTIALWSALVFGALVPARAEPVTPLRLEALVPSTSIAFVGIEEIGSWEARAADLSLAKMAKDPEMQAFLKPISEDVEKLLKGGGGKGPFADVPPIVFEVLEQLRGLKGQVAVALVRFKSPEDFAIAAGLDFGDHVGDFTKFLARMKEQAGDDFPLQVVEDKGRTWWTMGGPEAHGGPQLAATVLGTSILLSTDRAWLDEVVASAAAPMASSLAQSADFQGVKSGVGGADTALMAYANVPSILGQVGLDEEGARIVKALGADAITAVGYGCAFKGDGFLDTLVVQAPGADHGLLPLLRMRPSSHAALALAPATTFLYDENTIALSTLLPKVRTIVAAVDPEAVSQFERGLAEASRTLNVDLESELLAGFADETAVYLGVPETGGLFPELAVIAAVKDPAAFEGIFERAVNGIAGAASEKERLRVAQRTIEYRGKRLHVVDLEATRGKRIVPFTPTWAVLDGRLVVTLVPHAMKEFILRTSEGVGGLASQEDVRALLAAAPAGHGKFTYVDLQAAMNLVYDTGVPALQTIVKPNVLGHPPVRLDWAALPAARTMRPYFRSLAVFVSCDESGLRASFHSPVPAVPVLAAVSAVAGFVAMRGGRRGPPRDWDVEPPHEVVPRDDSGVEATLQGLAENVRSYRALQDALPESLADLVEKAHILPALPRDPWGGEIRYRIVDPKQGLFELRSAGPDKSFDTDDDRTDVFQAR